MFYIARQDVSFNALHVRQPPRKREAPSSRMATAFHVTQGYILFRAQVKKE
jgi:hypothetical protein